METSPTRTIPATEVEDHFRICLDEDDEEGIAPEQLLEASRDSRGGAGQLLEVFRDSRGGAG